MVSVEYKLASLSKLTWTDAKAAFLDEAVSAAKTLTAAEKVNIRQLVCATGDPGDSIGKILYDLYNSRLTITKSGYLDASINDVKTQTDKLAGAATTNNLTAKNWDTVNDSPDSVGGLVVTLGTAATKKKLHSLLLDVSALTNGAIITVKLFQKINDNADVCVYDKDFTVNTDPDGLWIVNGTLVIHDTLKVVVDSNTSESVAIEYTAVLEAM